MTAATESPVDTMTLTEHLSELRTRIIRAALAVILGAVLIIAFYDYVYDFLLKPYRDLCDSGIMDDRADIEAGVVCE